MGRVYNCIKHKKAPRVSRGAFDYSFTCNQNSVLLSQQCHK